MEKNALLSQISFPLNEKIYSKDPQSSDLGKKIIQHSILLINEIGLENFTFKKLAIEINTTESSIYRYFDNKHKLLIYLVSWYWVWIDYMLSFKTANIQCPKERLAKSLHVISNPTFFLQHVNDNDIEALHQIIINESSKAYLTKEIDLDNKEGFFLAYKEICKKIVLIIKEINPNYAFPSSLIATVIEGIHHQKFFKSHLPSLADTNQNNLEDFYYNLILKTIQ